MNWARPTRFEWISFLAMMPFLAMLLNRLLFPERDFFSMELWIYSFPIVMIQGAVSWYLHIAVMHWLRVSFPHIRQTNKRLVLLAISHILLIWATFIVLFYAYDATNFLDYTLDKSQLRTALLIGVALTLIATTMWESEYTFKQWKRSLAEKEKLEQLTIHQEFETLKSQVNPHFLFNCFNTLSSLITEDRKQAEVFLDELSKVYRYLLRNNEDGVSTLDTEIGFIRSYYKLLRTRHGEAVEMHIETDRKYDKYLLPSLSLQMLVENAVKHNVLSKNKPITIEIFTTAGNKLVVSNNLQVRPLKAPSNRIGLENIKTKYALLQQPGFQVLQDNKTFNVVLPLIWSRVNESRKAALES